MHLHRSPTRQPVRLVEHLMSDQLNAAIEALTSTFQSLDLVARALVVDAKEVADTLATCEEQDTAEFIALTALAKYNPYIPPPAKSTK